MKIFSTFIYCIITLVSLSQNPAILSQKVIGGSSDEYGGKRIDIPASTDYFLIGDSKSNISGDKSENSRGISDIWILRMDQNNNILWDKTIGGNNIEYFKDAILFNNKLHILSQSNSDVSGEKTLPNFGVGYFDYWLLSLDLNGNILWQNVFGGNNDDEPTSIIGLQNGNLLVGGVSKSGISGNKTSALKGGGDYWILEVNSNNGTIQNQSGIGSAWDDYLNIMYQDISGDILLIGQAFDGISGDKTDPGFGGGDIWIVKVDSNLSIIDDKCFGGTDGQDACSGIILENNDYYLICFSNSGNTGNKTAINQGTGYYDAWLFKMDVSMNIIWDKSYGGIYDDFGLGIIKVGSNKFLISSSSYSDASGNKTCPNYGDSDSWLILTDLDGNIIAQESYGGTTFDVGHFNFIQGSNAQLFFAGSSDSDVSGNKTVPSKGGSDYWIMELDASDFLNTDKLNIDASTISVYPNPFNGVVNFKFSDLNESVILTISTVDGKIIETKQIVQKTEIIEWKTSTSEQILFYEIKGENTIFKGKLISF